MEYSCIFATCLFICLTFICDQLDTGWYFMGHVLNISDISNILKLLAGHCLVIMGSLGGELGELQG